MLPVILHDYAFRAVRYLGLATLMDKYGFLYSKDYELSYSRATDESVDALDVVEDCAFLSRWF